MKPNRKVFALITAFTLCVVFTYAMKAYMNIAAGTEKMAQILVWNMAGNIAGALILPLLLPLAYLRNGDLRGGRRPSRYAVRLILTGLLFLPGTVTRFLVPEAVYLANNGILAFTSFSNGVGLALITGCFYSLVNRNRTLWAVLSTIAGIFVFYLIQGQGRSLPMPFLFTVIGLVPVIGGIFILVFLASATKNEELGIRNEELEDSVSKHNEVPQHSDNGQRSSIPNSSLLIPNSSSSSFLIPNFIFPLLAVLVIFLTSNITDRLFTPAMNYPFDSGFNPFVVALLLILALFGFLAAKEWDRFLRFFIFLCAGLFAISPSLLFFNRSETIFMVLYTLNTTATRMMTAVFPFVIVDLYWQGISSKRQNHSGYWAWFLAVSVYAINLVSLVMGALFKDIQFDNAYAVLALSLAAIVFFVLCLKVISKNKESSVPLSALGPSFDDISREYNLSEREKEVALLMLQEGLSDKEMGERLFISPRTVRDHVTSVYRKFGVKHRAAFLVKVSKTEMYAP